MTALDHNNGKGTPPRVSAEPGRICHPGFPLPSYFDPAAPVAFLSGDLPHWRQAGTTYFVTFRLADSLPQEKLAQWRNERGLWMKAHPEPHDESTRHEYYERFPQRFQQWLDAGAGSCILASPEANGLMEGVLRHFDRQRYTLGTFIVAPNHIHVLVTPLGEHTLSEILHTWKSFSAHEIGKVIKSDSGVPPPLPAEPGRLCHLAPGNRNVAKSGSGVPPLVLAEPGRLCHSASLRIWQKESFDHIVRSPASLEKFRAYIQNHGDAKSGSGVPPLLPPTPLRRDAAATL